MIVQDSFSTENVSILVPWRNSLTYKVYHEFAETGEWSYTETDMLCKALKWFDCKSKSLTQFKMSVILYGPGDIILKKTVYDN